MGQIKSSGQGAANVASDFSAGTETILGYSAASKDSTSTVSGNSAASSAIDNLSNHANAIAKALNQFAACIQQVDSNFHAVDSQVASEVQKNTKEQDWSVDTAKSNGGGGYGKY